MSTSMQTLIVLLAVAGSGLVLFRQGLAALTGKRSKLGNCCAKGCSTAKPQVVFIPADSLRSCRRGR